ncbi:MAG TPA: hypothetical protein VF620_13735 [Allosphingosinicella sp.]
MMRSPLLSILVQPILGAGLLLPIAQSAGARPADRGNAGVCAVPAGWSEVAKRRTRYIIFGESHGSSEAPAFVGKTACGLARKGERLLVAIEHQAPENDALQAAWKLPKSQFPAALRLTGWKGRNDGVGSEAMFELLLRLHSLKSDGKRIDVVGFNGARDSAQGERFKDLPGQGPHEAAQAENIRVAAEAKAYDHVLVLVGNLHARKQPVVRGGVSFEPMAMRLAPPQAITSLLMTHGSGSTWSCRLKPGVVLDPKKPLPPNSLDCANHPTRGVAELDKPPFLALGTMPGSDPDPAYDGFFWVGPVTGSPPAVPD